MKKVSTFLAAMLVLLGSLSAQQLKSPKEFLGHEPGEAFTWHGDAVSYFKNIAGSSENVIYKSYGKTNEGRELGVVFVSSAENIKNIEELRKNNLINIGLLEGESSGKQIPFISRLGITLLLPFCCSKTSPQPKTSWRRS